MDYTIRTILYATDLGPHGAEVFNLKRCFPAKDA